MFMTKMFFGKLWHRWLRRKNQFPNRPWLFKCWIALSTRQICVQWISMREFNYTIHRIEIYPMDSTIHLLKNWGLVSSPDALPLSCNKRNKQYYGTTNNYWNQSKHWPLKATYCSWSVWRRRVKKVEIPGQTQLLANNACLISSSQTKCSEKNNIGTTVFWITCLPPSFFLLAPVTVKNSM